MRRHAARLGLSRSEFFARAAERWADELEEAELTWAIDDALAAAGETDDELPFLRRAVVATLTGEGASTGPAGPA